jgi:hypothetical protein
MSAWVQHSLQVSSGLLRGTFSKQRPGNASHQPARTAVFWTEPERLRSVDGTVEAMAGRSIARKKTRPPAEYDADAALPCPDIEIGSRHPVKASLPDAARLNVI